MEGPTANSSGKSPEILHNKTAHLSIQQRPFTEPLPPSTIRVESGTRT
jgi:hypothetical protein